MKFYDPKKTFLDLMVNYQGDMDEAYNLFTDAWDEAGETGAEDRTLMQALGIESDEDYCKFMADEVDIPYLLKKYKNPAAASVS